MSSELTEDLDLFNDMDAFFDTKISNEEDRKAIRKFYNETGARENEHLNAQFKLWILQSGAYKNANDLIESFKATFSDTVIEQLATTNYTLELFKNNLLSETDKIIQNHMAEATELNNQMAIRTNDCINEVNQAFIVFNQLLSDKSSEFTSYIEENMAIIHKELDGRKMAQVATTELITTATMEIFPKVFHDATKKYFATLSEKTEKKLSKAGIVRQIIVNSTSLFIAGSLLYIASKFI